jgi:hypothetical protein
MAHSIDKDDSDETGSWRAIRRPIILLLPSLLLLVIELFGAAATDNDSRPIFPALGRFYWWFVGSGMLLSAVAPITSAAALAVALRRRPPLPKRVKLLLVTVCTAFVSASCLGCVWTFLSHPTWTQGFSGG